MAEEKAEQRPRKTYCWVNNERVCGGDCEAFDSAGAADMTGERTGCRLVNSLGLISRGALALGKWITEKRTVPGANVAPPRVQ